MHPNLTVARCRHFAGDDHDSLSRACFAVHELTELANAHFAQPTMRAAPYCLGGLLRAAIIVLRGQGDTVSCGIVRTRRNLDRDVSPSFHEVSLLIIPFASFSIAVLW